MFTLFDIILIKNGILEAWEVFKNLAGAGGFVVLEYQPVASHGDPIHAQNYTFP